MDEDTVKDTVKDASTLFGNYAFAPKSRKTERGELLKELSIGVGYPIPRIAYMVTKFSLQDLYYLVSDCRAATARGVPYGAAFNTALKPINKPNQKLSTP